MPPFANYGLVALLLGLAPALCAQSPEPPKKILRVSSEADLPQADKPLSIESEEDLKRLEALMRLQESMYEDEALQQDEREELLEAIRETYKQEQKPVVQPPNSY